nr:sugar transferase [Weissella cibaria]
MDELPQCFNVLRGEMSFVGPRPLAVTDMAVIEKRKVIGADRVLPGITGLAQVSGRNNVSDCQKAMYDGMYANQVSFTHDVSIVAATLIKVLKQSDIDKA